jgi:hypothetical protein
MIVSSNRTTLLTATTKTRKTATIIEWGIHVLPLIRSSCWCCSRRHVEEEEKKKNKDDEIESTEESPQKDNGDSLSVLQNFN